MRRVAERTAERARVVSVAALVTFLGACESTPVAPPRDDGPRGITIEHHYSIYPTYAEYVAAFKRANPRPLYTCTEQQSVDGLPPSLSTTASAAASSDSVQKLGVVQVWARGDYIYGLIRDLFFRIPARFLDSCTGAWRYGPSGPGHEEGANDDAGLYELPDNPETVPPEGMTEEEWNELNPAEKVLAWQTFWKLGPSEFKKFVERMRAIRQEATDWANRMRPCAGVPSCGEDDEQDAFRHAYWQCRMTQAFGSEVARNWGDAHEKYAIKPNSARMDLLNNDAGRRIASRHGDCGLGVVDEQGILRTAPVPPPSGDSPHTAQPPAPPLDAT